MIMDVTEIKVVSDDETKILGHITISEENGLYTVTFQPLENSECDRKSEDYSISEDDMPLISDDTDACECNMSSALNAVKDFITPRENYTCQNCLLSFRREKPYKYHVQQCKDSQVKTVNKSIKVRTKICRPNKEEYQLAETGDSAIHQSSWMKKNRKSSALTRDVKVLLAESNKNLTTDKEYTCAKCLLGFRRKAPYKSHEQQCVSKTTATAKNPKCIKRKLFLDEPTSDKIKSNALKSGAADPLNTYVVPVKIFLASESFPYMPERTTDLGINLTYYIAHKPWFEITSPPLKTESTDVTDVKHFSLRQQAINDGFVKPKLPSGNKRIKINAEWTPDSNHTKDELLSPVESGAVAELLPCKMVHVKSRTGAFETFKIKVVAGNPAETFDKNCIKICHFCKNFRTCSGQYLRQHVRANHPICCWKCKKTFGTLDELQQHKPCSVSEMNHCMLCKKFFISESFYNRHTVGREHKKLELVERDTLEKLARALTSTEALYNDEENLDATEETAVMEQLPSRLTTPEIKHRYHYTQNVKNFAANHLIEQKPGLFRSSSNSSTDGEFHLSKVKSQSNTPCLQYKNTSNGYTENKSLSVKERLSIEAGQMFIPNRLDTLLARNKSANRSAIENKRDTPMSTGVRGRMTNRPFGSLISPSKQKIGSNIHSSPTKTRQEALPQLNSPKITNKKVTDSVCDMATNQVVLDDYGLEEFEALFCAANEMNQNATVTFPPLRKITTDDDDSYLVPF